jgi:uncharacterized membrane protein
MVGDSPGRGPMDAGDIDTGRARGRPPRRERWHRALVAPVPPVACWFALACWWASVFPTLMPRTWWAQGVISAVSVTAAIAVGTLASWVVRALARRFGRTIPRVVPFGWRIFAGIATVVVVAGCGAWVTWQNEQRRLLSMATIGARWAVPMVVATVAVGVVLFVMGRTGAWAVRRLDRRITVYVPRPVAIVLTVVVVATLAVVVTREVVADSFLDWASDRFGAFDDETPPGVVRPTTPNRSGGPGSLAAWGTLGYEGRRFAAGGPTTEQLRAFAGPGATVEGPIRVYAGLESADGPEAQARLAVEELDRTGAWDRSLLVVVTVTGTGWVDPVSAAAVEYLRNGDTAIVASQYSYFPSWLSFLVDADEAAESSRALIGAVSDRWAQMPVAHRPRLVVFGLSLGSYGTEEALAGDDLGSSLANAAAEADAVLLAGATFANPVWHQVIDARSPGSPVFAPVTPGVALLGAPGAPPLGGRFSGRPFVYVTHPTDPVTWVSTSSLYRRPDWMGPPTGVGVPTPLQWAPGVTFAQEVFDLMAGFGAPPGYGHDYDPNMADAWVAVAAPDSWSAQETLRLREVLLPLEDDGSSS